MARRLAFVAAIASGWVALVVYWLSDPHYRGYVVGERVGIRIGRMQLINRRNVA
jgi:hypothetical protein